MICEVEGCEREAIAEARFKPIHPFISDVARWTESALDRLEGTVIHICSVHGGGIDHLNLSPGKSLTAARDRPR